MVSNILLFMIWVILLVGFFFTLFTNKKRSLRKLFILFVISLVIGSLLLYFVLFFNEADIAWNSLFFFPLFYLYSLYFIVSLILKVKNSKH